MNRIALKRIALVLALSAVIGAVQAGDGAPDLSKVNGSLVAEAGRTYGDIDIVIAIPIKHTELVPRLDA